MCFVLSSSWRDIRYIAFPGDRTSGGRASDDMSRDMHAFRGHCSSCLALAWGATPFAQRRPVQVRPKSWDHPVTPKLDQKNDAGVVRIWRRGSRFARLLASSLAPFSGPQGGPIFGATISFR